PRGSRRPASDDHLDRLPRAPVRMARARRLLAHPGEREPPAELRVVDRSGVDASEALAGKLRTLIQLIELISSSLDTGEILREIAAAAVRVADARSASLWVAVHAPPT